MISYPAMRGSENLLSEGIRPFLSLRPRKQNAGAGAVGKDGCQPEARNHPVWGDTRHRESTLRRVRRQDSEHKYWTSSRNIKNIRILPRGNIWALRLVSYASREGTSPWQR